MKYTLNGTSPNQSALVIESELDKFQTQIDAINNSISLLQTVVDGNSADIITNSNTDANNLANAVLSLEAMIRTVQTNLTDYITANSQGISTGTFSATTASADKLSATDSTVVNEKVTSLTATTAAADTLNAADAYLTKATVTTLNATNATADTATLKTATIDNAAITNLTQKHIIATDVTADKVITDAVATDTITSSKELNITGATNTLLAYISFKCNGIVTLYNDSGAVTVSPSGVSNNSAYLYAADNEKGIITLYFDTDATWNMLTVGTFSNYTSGTVSKGSIRHNADSNGDVNVEGNVRIAVVSSLPTLGMKNVIYIVIGDSSYYSDGIYFYQMTSKHN